MTTEKRQLSDKRINRLRTQGFEKEPNQLLSELAFGIRFPFRVCLTLLLVGIATQSIAIFTILLLLSSLSLLLPLHPIDYVYNSFSKTINRPKMISRPRQLKFACAISTVLLAVVLGFLIYGNAAVAIILAGMLAFVASLPAFLDICIPSIIYTFLFKPKSPVLSANASIQENG